jgi:hypothetical protein
MSSVVIERRVLCCCRLVACEPDGFAACDILPVTQLVQVQIAETAELAEPSREQPEGFACRLFLLSLGSYHAPAEITAKK